MSARELKKLYPGRIEQRAHKYLDGAHYLRIKDAEGGKGVLIFEANEKGKVTRWRVGLPPPVDYVEGCA